MALAAFHKNEGAGVNNWDIMAPYAQVGFKPGQDVERFQKELLKVPGVKRKGAGWNVPGNAVKVVALLSDRFGVDLAYAKWAKNPVPPPEWAQVERSLAAMGEVQPWVLDGFLTPYQQQAICFGWCKSGVHFWHPTGSGKTLSGIISGLSVPGPLIIVTRAASRLQYGREVERFTILKAHVLRPEGQKRGLMTVAGQTWVDFFKEQMPEFGRAALVAEAWTAAKARHGVLVKKGSSLVDYQEKCKAANRRPVVVVGWEALALNLKALKALKPGAVVFDELHQGKNAKRWEVVPIEDPEGATDGEKLGHIQMQMREAKKHNGFVKETEEGFKMFLPVLNRASAAADLSRCVLKRIGTTATPIKDRVRDLWSQLDIVEPNAHGNKTTWENRHADRKPGAYGGYDTRGSSNLPELKLRLESIAHILNYEDTHRHLPPKRRQSVYLAPEDQCRPTGGFAKERKDAAKRGATAMLEVGLAEAASRKRPAVIGLVEDHVASKQKVVLFTGRRRDCEALGKSIRSAKLIKKDEVTVYCAHGGNTQRERDEIIQEYMAHPGPCVLVGTGPAFGESLNIHDTDAAFFVMLPYTPGQLRQWEGRFCRLGQKRPVVIYYVIAEGTVDEHMAAILIDKLPAVEKVVEDSELGAAKPVLAGFDPNETDEEFCASILADLDWG